MEKTDHQQKLYTKMRLWEFPDKYVIEPSDGSSGSRLAVSREDASMSLIDDIPHCSSLRVPKIKEIFGVVGMLKLVAGSYLIVITEREHVGSYMGHPIFRVASLKVLPCDHSLKNSPIEQADPRFVWNNYIMEVLIDSKLDPFLLPVLQGSFHNFQAAIGKDIIDVTLIARRCNRRTGTRMWRRGADSDGYVANFVESEQILLMNGFTASFVQVRGSIPLLWDQIVDLTYKPKFEIVRQEEAPRVIERHFLDLRKKYGNVIAIDLVNKLGGEGHLSERFCNAMQHSASEEVKYLHFDFHHMCGHVHFENLSILYDQIEGFLTKNRYFLLNEKGEKVETQLGVVRTNCIDCLDRTNVTQSMIGRKMLEFQFKRLGIFSADETISSHPNLDESFKKLWADHGDDISIQYSGTPALKGDFVRCGQRTAHGIMADGYNALKRYYLNNFQDGTKQDAIDLLQGHYIVSVARDTMQSSQRGGIEAVASFPVAFALIMLGLFLAALSLRQVRNDPWNLLFSMIWASMSVGIAAFVKANGRAFCNRPRLHQPRR